MTNLKPAHCYEMVRCTSANMNKNCLPSFSWDLRNKASSLIVVKRASRNRKHFGQREKWCFLCSYICTRIFVCSLYNLRQTHSYTTFNTFLPPFVVKWSWCLGFMASVPFLRRQMSPVAISRWSSMFTRKDKMMSSALACDFPPNQPKPSGHSACQATNSTVIWEGRLRQNVSAVQKQETCPSFQENSEGIPGKLRMDKTQSGCGWFQIL